MSGIDGYTFEKEPRERTEIYTYYSVSKEGQRYLAKVFKLETLTRLQLETVLEYNTEVLWTLREHPNWLRLKLISNYDYGSIHYYEWHEHSLQDYIQAHPVSEKEAVLIVRDIMAAVYAAYEEDYYPVNLRPQHFVQVREQWKLASLVYDQDLHQGLKSALVWDPTRQAPEAFAGQLSEVQMCNSLVWDIGSMLLNMLQGVHQLTSLEKIKKMEASGFRLDSLKLSVELVKLLKQMLQADPDRRLKLIDLYQHPLFTKKQYNMEVLEGSIQRSTLRSTMRSRVDMLQMSQKSLISKSNAQQRQFHKNFVVNEPKQVRQVQLEPLGRNEDFAHMISGDLGMESVIKNPKLPVVSVNRPCNNTAVIAPQKSKHTQSNGIENSLRLTNLSLDAGMIRSITFTEEEWKPAPINVKTGRLPPQKEAECINVYKKEMDKSEMFTHISSLLNEFAFRQNKEAWIAACNLVMKFQAALIIFNLADNLNRIRNAYELDSEVFEEFVETEAYRNLKLMYNKVLGLKREALQKARSQAKPFPPTFLKPTQHSDYTYMLVSSLEETTLERLRTLMKQLLNSCYHFNVEEYRQTKSEDLIRLNFSVVQLINISKVYHDSNRETLWAPLLAWKKLPTGSNFTFADALEYMEKAPIRTVFDHLNLLLKELY